MTSENRSRSMIKEQQQPSITSRSNNKKNCCKCKKVIEGKIYRRYEDIHPHMFLDQTLLKAFDYCEQCAPLERERLIQLEDALYEWHRSLHRIDRSLWNCEECAPLIDYLNNKLNVDLRAM